MGRHYNIQDCRVMVSNWHTLSDFYIKEVAVNYLADFLLFLNCQS